MGTPFPLPVAALPTDSSAVPQRAGALTLLQSLSQLPALFLSVAVSSVSWIEHAAWGPQGDNLAFKSVQYRSRSFQSSRTIPWPHQELKVTAAGTRGLSAKLLHKSNDEHSALGVWGSNYFRGSTVDLCFLGGLEKTLEHLNQPFIWIQGFQCKVIVGESKRRKAASSSTATCLSVPPKCPKIPFNHQSFSNFLHIYKGGGHLGKQLPLNMEMLRSWWKHCSQSLHPVSHTSHQSLLTNYQSKIQSAPLYFSSRVTNFSTVPKTIFF